MEPLRQHLGGTHDYALQCPRAAPSVGLSRAHTTIGSNLLASTGIVVSCPFLVVQLFLHFRLASHRVPVVVGHFAGGQHVARADAHTVVVWLLRMKYT